MSSKIDDDTLERLRELHEKGDDPVHALMCALQLCWRRQRLIPDWVFYATNAALNGQRYKRKGRGCRSPAERQDDTLRGLQRWATVEALREVGLPWDEVQRAIDGNEWPEEDLPPLCRPPIEGATRVPSKASEVREEKPLPDNETALYRAFYESWKRFRRAF